MKIAIFSKPYTTKVYSFLIAILLTASIPFGANASVFDLIFGTNAIAEETTIIEGESSSDLNSQNMPLLESSVNPDLKNINELEDTIIVQDDSFIYNNGLLDSGMVLDKSPLSDKINIYVVKEGDTLSQIAELFDISVNTIRWENNISGQSIRIGQKLNILPVTGVKHIVKSGDTISKIATKYEAESEDILIFNDISAGDGLKKGDIVFVPNGIIKPVVAKIISSGSNKTSSSNTKAPSGYYIKPAVGIITSPYGPRKGGFHYGVDIGNKRGTSIMAAASGIVVKVVSGCVEGRTNCGGRYGNYIVVEHSNGTRTFYAHLSRTSVAVGQSVSQGESIGALGSTGRSTGPHLHFEVENANGSKMRPTF